jgi:hypothetical protein
MTARRQSNNRPLDNFYQILLFSGEAVKGDGTAEDKRTNGSGLLTASLAVNLDLEHVLVHASGPTARAGRAL